MLTKGPLGAVLPFLIVLLYLLKRKDFYRLIKIKWLAGILIVIIVISPTLIYLYRNFGIEGFKFYFITNNLGRIDGTYAGSSADPLFYIKNLIWALLPWTYVVLISFYHAIKKSNTSENSWIFAFWGSILVLLVILSIAKGKAPNYFLI